MQLGKNKQHDPAVAKLEEQVKGDVGRLRWRLATRRDAPVERRDPRRTGRLYDVISTCLGDAGIES